MIRVGILGAKGYTAGELMRMLAGHPEAKVVALMARVEALEPVEKYFPSLRGQVAVAIEPIDAAKLAESCDAVFLALPHTVAQEYAPALIEKGIKVIDLSADFRFDSVELYETTYKVKHLAPELNGSIPYGMPELYRAKIKEAQAVANPGCHTSAAILALAPLMKRGDVLDLDRISIDSLTGVSGGGRAPSEKFHFPEANESVQAYSVPNHRHRPEIEEQLSAIAGRAIKLSFTAILVPMNRGILSCIAVPMKKAISTGQALEWLRTAYLGEPFVRVMPEGTMPSTAGVFMTNFCDIGAAADPHSGMLLVFSALDNLVKGASGQAIQNMNVLFGLDETLGLLHS